MGQNYSHTAAPNNNNKLQTWSEQTIITLLQQPLTTSYKLGMWKEKSEPLLQSLIITGCKFQNSLSCISFEFLLVFFISQVEISPLSEVNRIVTWLIIRGVKVLRLQGSGLVIWSRIGVSISNQMIAISIWWKIRNLHYYMNDFMRHCPIINWGDKKIQLSPKIPKDFWRRMFYLQR